MGREDRMKGQIRVRREVGGGGGGEWERGGVGEGRRRERRGNGEAGGEVRR